MTRNRFTCTIDGCGETFATKSQKHEHRRTRHGKSDPHYRPMAGMSPDDIYDFVDAMDLPDGAHWAMIEELSGLEPGDFV